MGGGPSGEAPSCCLLCPLTTFLNSRWLCMTQGLESGHRRSGTYSEYALFQLMFWAGMNTEGCLGITEDSLPRDSHRWTSSFPQGCVGDLLCFVACSRTFLDLPISTVGSFWGAVEGSQPGLVVGAQPVFFWDSLAHLATAFPLL